MALALSIAVALARGGTAEIADDSESAQDRLTADGPDSDDVQAEGPLPPAPLLAAERFVADPRAATLRSLVEAVGGLDSVVLGEAEGAFDLVRFDPLDPDRLIASVRSSYGPAQNQGRNERWQIDGDGLTQAPFDPDTAHDFAHYNRDGTITMWARDGEGADFGPRSAIVLDRTSQPQRKTQPMFASRFAVVSDTVFALTGDGDYYSTSDSYQQLIADGSVRRVLDSGQRYGWIDTPTPDLLVAYPRDADGTTAVWSTETLEPLRRHPLAGRAYQRVAVSDDRSVAVGVTFDGRMEQIDLETGRLVSRFGTLDPRDIDQPLTLNHDGTMAVTVDRSGEVSLWWVGDDGLVASIKADSAQPRWVPARHAARSASAVSATGERIAVRVAARPRQPVRWPVLDIRIDSWISRACTLAGRPLTAEERDLLNLGGQSAACV